MSENNIQFGKIKRGQKRKLDEDEIMDISDGSSTDEIENLNNNSTITASSNDRKYFQNHKKIKQAIFSSQIEHERILNSVQQAQQKQEQQKREEEEERKLKPKIESILHSLEKDQIIDILSNLLDKNPKLNQDILSLIPRPTLKSVTNQLQAVEKKLNNSFPYTKWGADRSDYSFNRVKPNLMELLDLTINYLKYFTNTENYGEELEREYPVVSMGYLEYATQLALRLPVWNQNYHNEITRELLLKKIGEAWEQVINEIGQRVQNGKVYSSSLVGEWIKSLIKYSNELNGKYGFAESVKLFKEKLGWLIGLYPVTGETSLMNSSQYLSLSFPSHPLNYSNVTGLIGFRT
ncbi:Cut8-domain-containing protein [Anaeromyces robustus]|uniref:Tethering factor for nuclear proteasome STS1 n=1 Tax=Anaeromyces robustus TaxID=1754192 RepID=A0A1Y1XIM2_9FUNG|nr:Cut8-domain-containing protein [Anaeromyces robustus]|eukprot:ORX85611.1 Cut8-domain-containing protein [Anaeromyces robustus]